MRRLDEVRTTAARVAQQRAEVDGLRAALAEAQERLVCTEAASTEMVNRCTAYLAKLADAGFKV